MNLLDYIRGNRKGKDAHRIERESMQDPFLSDAIDGFDSVNDDHIARIEDIQKRIKAKSIQTTKRKYLPLRKLVAACLVGTIALSGYFIISGTGGKLQAQQVVVETIEIFVPEQYYTENIVVIAQSNTEQMKAYIPDIPRFEVTDKMMNSVSDSDMKLLAMYEAPSNAPIDIYQPREVTKPSAQRMHEEARKTIAFSVAMPEVMADADVMEDSKVDEMAFVAALEPVKPAPIQTSERAMMSKSSRKKIGAADHLILESIPAIGWDAYNKYIAENMKRPKGDCKSVTGNVVLEFSISQDGAVSDILIIESLCPALDEEAIRLLIHGGKWKQYLTPARLTISF